MYSNNSKNKIYFLLSDIFSLFVTYTFLSFSYSYGFFASKFFAVLFGFVVLIIGILTDEYSDVPTRGYLKELKHVLFYATTIVVLFGFVLILGKARFLSDIAHLSYTFIAQAWLFSAGLIFLGRTLVKWLTKKVIVEPRKVLVMTNFTKVEELEQTLSDNNYEITAYVSKMSNHSSLLPILKDISAIRDFIANHQIDEIFIDNDARSEYAEAGHYFKLLGVPTTVNLSGYSEYYVGDSVIKKIDNMTFVTTAINVVNFRQLALKRLMDIVMALIGVLLTGIVAVFIAPIVKKQSPGPLMFKQKRVGKNGKVFEIYKFRSMYTDAEERKKELMAQNDLETDLMFKMDNDPRIFPFGHKIRDWSIDELPQFINVLKGDMSVVGTRPPTLEEYQNYELHHFKRLAAKPGITGMWQVSGRSNITDFEEVVALDMKYIQNWSIAEDIKIIFKTFAVVLKKEGSK